MFISSSSSSSLELFFECLFDLSLLDDWEEVSFIFFILSLSFLFSFSKPSFNIFLNISISFLLVKLSLMLLLPFFTSFILFLISLKEGTGTFFSLPSSFIISFSFFSGNPISSFSLFFSSSSFLLLSISDLIISFSSLLLSEL